MSSPATNDPPALLIVEDDPDVLAALRFMAETRRYDVASGASAQDALDIAADRRLDCLIIDQKLPDRPGVDLLAMLRARGVRAPAILITTAPSPDLRRRAAIMGAPIVEKPLLDEALFTEVRRLLTPGSPA